MTLPRLFSRARTRSLHLCFVAALALLSACGGDQGKSVTLLNVSYDPTRELYRDVNAGFGELWQQQHGERVFVRR